MRAFITEEEQISLVETIKTAEAHSTGEIRVHIDTSTAQESLEVAYEVFDKLGMQNTKDRNAVLFHINFKQKYLSIVGDEGIHEKVCQTFWDAIRQQMIEDFANGQYYNGLKKAILTTGGELKKHFPDEDEEYSNELPNEITIS